MNTQTQESPPVRGVYAALATPRRPNCMEADTAGLLDYLDAVTQTGVDGLVLFGATGEFVHFDIEERMRVAGLAIKRTRVPMLVNVSHSSLIAAVELAESAMSLGASGLLLMPPYFYQYNDAQIAEFYSRFLETTAPKVPLFLYNLPFYTNPISDALMERLLLSDGIAGIKDSSGQWTVSERLLNLRSRRSFTLMVGHESVYNRGRSAGADGIVSGISAAIPELIVALDRSIVNRDSERADALDARLQEFVAQLNRFPGTVAIKQAAIVRGWIPNQFALPFDPQTAADLAEFRLWFEGWLPVVLSETGQKLARV